MYSILLFSAICHLWIYFVAQNVVCLMNGMCKYCNATEAEKPSDSMPFCSINKGFS